MAFLGGFFNIMDRTTVATFTYNNHATFEYNVVVDYFRFFTSAIFNFPDIFVLTGIIGATLLYFITTIITYSKLKKSEKPK
jgi:signal peptidase II